MDPRYQRYPTRRRSPVGVPARSTMPSIPTTVAYSSHYGGDDLVLSPSHYEEAIPQHMGDPRSSALPGTTTTTTYTVRKDPITRTSSVREGTGTRAHRSSTVDSTQKRPVILTANHPGRPHGAGSTVSSSLTVARSGSPPRESYRQNDDSSYYAQPASSIRSRNYNRGSSYGPYSATLDNEDFRRLRERQGDERLAVPRADPYRSSRPTSIYASNPRDAAIEYVDQGYEYTKPSDLVRYDLDNDRAPRQRRRESFGRDYYRPSVSVSTDLDRPYEARARGPPPTSQALDKYNRSTAAGIYDRPQVRMPVPPPVPLAPVDPRRSGHLLHVPPIASPTERGGSSSRTRPVSLYQEGQPPHYRGREDDPIHRQLRSHDRDRDRDYYFHDDAVGQRGFGVRTDDVKDREDLRRRDPDYRGRERRERRREHDDDREPKRRSDEELELERSAQREARRAPAVDRDRRASRDPTRKEEEVRVERRGVSNEKENPAPDDKKGPPRDKVKDKVAAGLSVAAASLGLAPALRDGEEKKDKGSHESPRRRRESVDGRRRDSDNTDADLSRTADKHKPKNIDPDERETASPTEAVAVEQRTEPSRKEHPDDEDAATRERNRREAEARPDGGPVDASGREGSSSPEEGKPKKSRFGRRRQPNAFKPNDTADLMDLKAKLAAMETTSDRDKERTKEKPAAAARERSPDRRRSPPSARRESAVESAVESASASVGPSGDASRGRELVPAAGAEAEEEVRVVSPPPRDKDEKKPIKGILKQPSSKFPEEPNPVREGVAPHKDDKTKANMPPGARWTKISRKLVNPEALTVGKERFEVRDDFVIVLRVLSREEIEAYTTATAQLREMRRQEHEKDGRHDHDRDDDDRRRHHRHRHDRDGEDDDRDRDRSDRHHRHRHHSDDELEEYPGHSHHHSSHRNRDRDRGRDREFSVAGGSD